VTTRASGPTGTAAGTARQRRGLNFLLRRATCVAGEFDRGADSPEIADRRVEITGPTDRKMIIKATVLIERCWLRSRCPRSGSNCETSIGLNTGWWDYTFSIIKSSVIVSPLVDLRAAAARDEGCHPRSRRVRAVPRLDVKVVVGAHEGHRHLPDHGRAERSQGARPKERKPGPLGRGTSVAHPDLVPVGEEVFDRTLGPAPNQLARRAR
jgi:hypothetical protein